ncbi:MAG: hypothetical protein V4651_04870 [Bacteroidota bacterium]
MCTYNLLNEDRSDERELLQKELAELNEELKKLQRNHAFGNIEKELYETFRKEQQDKIGLVTEKLSKIQTKISNLELFINNAISIAQNISKY